MVLFLRLCFGPRTLWCASARNSFERLVALVPEVVRVAPQEGQHLMPVALGVDLRGHGVLRAGDDDEPADDYPATDDIDDADVTADDAEPDYEAESGDDGSDPDDDESAKSTKDDYSKF